MPSGEFAHYGILAELVRDWIPKSYLEVGVQEGKSLAAVLTVDPTIPVLTLCDSWGPYHGGTNRGAHAHIDKLLARLRFTGTVQYYDMQSMKMWPLLQGQYDLVFIDGDHSEGMAYLDLTEGWKHCDGVLVAHDLNYPPVRAAWDRFLKMPNEVDVEIDVREYAEDKGTGVVVRL